MFIMVKQQSSVRSMVEKQILFLAKFSRKPVYNRILPIAYKEPYIIHLKLFLSLMLAAKNSSNPTP